FAAASRSSRPHYAGYGSCHLLPPGALDREPFPPDWSEAVVAGATVGGGRLPSCHNQATPLQAGKRGEERAMVYSEHIFGQPLDRTGYFVSVRRTARERAQHHHVQRALQQLQLLRSRPCHACSTRIASDRGLSTGRLSTINLTGKRFGCRKNERVARAK